MPSIPPRWSLGALLVPVALLLSAISLAAQDDALRRGIELYRAGRYADAVQPLRSAYQAQQTRDEARPWLIAALGASRQEIGFIDLATSTGHYMAYRIGENRSCVLTGRTFVS